MIGTCLPAQEGKAIQKSLDGQSKSIAILLYIYRKNRNRASITVRENQIELLIPGIGPALMDAASTGILSRESGFPVAIVLLIAVMYKYAAIGIRFYNF